VKVKIVCIGKTKRGYLGHGIKEYLERLKHYAGLEWVELQSSSKNRSFRTDERLKQEAEKIRSHIRASAIIVVLTEGGKELSSVDFSKWLEHQMIEGKQEINFILGGDQGLDSQLLADADLCLSLSRMTFTHQMTRLILLEQLYRAFTIIRGEPYHHG